MGLKLELNVIKQLVFILLCLYLICAEYGFETLGSTSEQIRLMAFCLHTDVIDVGLETIRSISDKIVIITYLLTPWSRVLLEKLTSKLCS